MRANESWRLDGPPWGGYVEDDATYLRGQIASVGSGLLGGWSGGTSGGAFSDESETDEDVRAEVKRLAHDDRPLPPDGRGA